MNRKKLIFLLAIFFLTAFLYGQENKESVKASLVYYFISYVDWPNENKIDQYTIGVLSANKLIYDELLQISKIKKIKNKPIRVFRILDIETIPQVEVLYVDSEFNPVLQKIAQDVANKHVLLISNNCSNRLVTMINFVHRSSEAVVEYEANKQNLKNEGFSYKKELLVYGGTQVDIKELLSEAEHKLSVVLDSIRLLETQISSREKELNQKNNTIDELYSYINGYKSDIKEYQTELSRKNIQFREVSEQIALKQKLLEEKNQELNFQKKQQQYIIREINNKRNDLEKVRTNLEAVKKESSIQQKKITSQGKILSSQASRLQTQRRQLLLIILLLVVTLIAIITLFRSYRFKRKANDELSFSNDELLANQEELKQTIQKLRETQDQLIQSEKMASLGMLTAGIAHEINNPINFINSGNELLPEITAELEKKLDSKPDSSEILDNLKLIYSSIQTGVERTSEIISSLRNYIRLENDAFTSHDIIDSMHDAILILRNRHKDRVLIHEQIGEIPKIECIPGKIYQVFVNLISNSIDAIKQEGDIFIAINNLAESGEIEIVFTDSGTGINKEQLPNIFNPFFTTKEVGKGTGLGLYIVYGIIQQHNGHIIVESEAGKGTTFRIKLPVLHLS